MKKIDLLKEQRLFILEKIKMYGDTWCGDQAKEELIAIDKKIENSKRGKKAKTSGANYERTVSKILNEHFAAKNIPLDMKRTPGSGGFQKTANNKSLRGDTSNLNEDYDFILHLECKNATTWSLPAWLKQAQGDCPPGKIPIVAFHCKQKIENGKVVQKSRNYVCLELEDLLQIIDERKVAKCLNSNS